MIDFLLGVPGKLKTISDYLSGTLYPYLSGTLYPYITSRTANLDATVSSRAVASTALSNATWTDTRAAKLDIIAAQSSVIKSIQRGSVYAATTITTVTITAVDTSKSLLLVSDAAVGSGYATKGELTNSTTLTFGNQSGLCNAAWQVVEFK